MKQVLFFLIVLTICGSLIKAPVIEPCGTKIESKFYLKGKLVHVNIQTSGYVSSPYPEVNICYMHNKVEFRSDSIRYKIYFKK